MLCVSDERRSDQSTQKQTADWHLDRQSTGQSSAMPCSSAAQSDKQPAARGDISPDAAPDNPPDYTPAKSAATNAAESAQAHRSHPAAPAPAQAPASDPPESPPPATDGDTSSQEQIPAAAPDKPPARQSWRTDKSPPPRSAYKRRHRQEAKHTARTRVQPQVPKAPPRI